MLEDVRNVSSFLESFDEAAGPALVALMQLKRRNRFNEAFVEAWDLNGSDGFERAKSYIAGDYGCEAPVIGPSQRTDASYLELGGIEPDFFFGCD